MHESICLKVFLKMARNEDFFHVFLTIYVTIISCQRLPSNKSHFMQFLYQKVRTENRWHFC
jgi:hypothetical protein